MTKLMIKRPLNPFRVNSFPTLFPSDIFDEFDSLLGNIFDAEHSTLSLRKGFPKGDVFVKDGNTVIELALAGYSKEQLSVKVKDNSLIVAASKDEGSSGESGRSLKRSAFTRVFPNFANEWNLESSNVEYKDGLLRITVPPMVEQEKEAIELDIK
jgi:HSP20 family molecular chaperone IbpA